MGRVFLLGVRGASPSRSPGYLGLEESRLSGSLGQGGGQVIKDKADFAAGVKLAVRDEPEWEPRRWDPMHNPFDPLGLLGNLVVHRRDAKASAKQIPADQPIAGLNAKLVGA